MKFTMKRRFLVLLAVLVFVLSSCGDGDAPICSDDKPDTFLYSNLVDDEGQEQLIKLIEHEISRENIDTVLRLIDGFYSVPYNNIVVSGFKESTVSTFSYSEEDAYEHLDNHPDDLIICRTAAFVLLKDSFNFAETTATVDGNKDKNNRHDFFSADDSAHYDLLFSDIDTDNVESSKQLSEKVIENWRSAGIAFPDEDIKLVTVYGSIGGIIQNFHTAVAIYTNECVWLFENTIRYIRISFPVLLMSHKWLIT